MPPSRTQRTTPGNATHVGGTGEHQMHDHVRAEAGGGRGLDEHAADGDVLGEPIGLRGLPFDRERRRAVDGGTGVATLLDHRRSPRPGASPDDESKPMLPLSRGVRRQRKHQRRALGRSRLDPGGKQLEKPLPPSVERALAAARASAASAGTKAAVPGTKSARWLALIPVTVAALTMLLMMPRDRSARGRAAPADRRAARSRRSVRTTSRVRRRRARRA